MARTARKTGLALVWHIAGLAWSHPGAARLRGGVTAATGAGLAVAFATYNAADPSLNAAGPSTPTNALGAPVRSALVRLWCSVAGSGLRLRRTYIVVVLGLCRAAPPPNPPSPEATCDCAHWLTAAGVLALAAALALPAPPAAWPLAKGLGGLWGDALLGGFAGLLAYAHLPLAHADRRSRDLKPLIGLAALGYAIGLRRAELRGLGDWLTRVLTPKPKVAVKPERAARVAARARGQGIPDSALDPAPVAFDNGEGPKVKPPKLSSKESPRELREAQSTFEFLKPGGFALPELSMLAKPKPPLGAVRRGSSCANSAALLESGAGRIRRPRRSRPDPSRPCERPLFTNWCPQLA